MMRNLMVLVEGIKPTNIFSMTGDAQAQAVAAFESLAKAQRQGRPEILATSMRSNPSLFHGMGLFTMLAEHVGDLTHRMCNHPIETQCGFATVTEKVERATRYLTGGYYGGGWEKDVAENVKSNYSVAKEKGTNLSFEEYVEQWQEGSQLYGAAHKKLMVYNDAQKHARDAAVSLGYHQWDEARSHIAALKKHLTDEATWIAFAGQFPRG